MVEDFESCYRAVQSRDARFDGWFFTAVTSTHIYCRPSCPAQTPKAQNVRFYPSAAAAQTAGFRACKRCRPDASPGSPQWDARADVAARAMRLIADGLVDREGVPGLAAHLGYSVRQLERTLQSEIGAGPIAIARAQRAQTARILIESTGLSMVDVALAAGFSSVRQFNDTVRAVFDSSPTTLRSRSRSALIGTASPTTDIVLRLPFRKPLCPDNLFGHLAATAIPGVEEVRDGTYRRTLRLAHGPGVVELTPTPDYVRCRAVLSDMRDLTATIARCRWLLDLDADPVAIDRQLGDDGDLRSVIEKNPGRRVPRCVDGDEMALRAVLGQHISTAAARTHSARLVREHGEPVTDARGTLDRLFPTSASLLGADPALPEQRRRAFFALASALADERLSLGSGCDRAEAMSVLAGLEGIGPWTRQVIAMRALGDPDAFLETDLGVRRAAERLDLPSTPAALVGRAARWRPWRAYAVQYLWSLDTHPINRWPPADQSNARHTKEHVP